MGSQNECVFVEVLEHLFKGNGVVREDGEDVLLCERLGLFGYFDVMGKDGGADEDGFVHVEFGTVGAVFRTELDDKDGCCEIAGVGGRFC